MKIVNAVRRPSDNLHMITKVTIKNAVNLYGSIDEAWEKHNDPDLFISHLKKCLYANEDELYYFIMLDIADLALDYLINNFSGISYVARLKKAKLLLHNDLEATLREIKEAASIKVKEAAESNIIAYSLTNIVEYSLTVDLYRLINTYATSAMRLTADWCYPCYVLYGVISNKKICDVFRKHVPEFPALNELHYY